MSDPAHVLVLGHSFIARLEKFIQASPSRDNFGFSNDVVHLVGIPGANIARLVSRFHRYASSSYKLVCLQCGGNDLSRPNFQPNQVVAAIIDFVHSLLRCGVQKIAVCQLFRRERTRRHKGDVPISVYNARVAETNDLLARSLEIPGVVFWKHTREIWNENELLCQDGVHFHNMKPYYRSIKGCILYSLKR